MDIKRMGARLTALRGNIPVRQVANACRVTISSMLRYEAGEKIPNDEVKQSLAGFYGVAVEDIFNVD